MRVSAETEVTSSEQLLHGRFILCAICAAVFALLCQISPAMADDPSLPAPPLAQVIDQNRVNLTNESVLYDGPSISIGPANQGGLSYASFSDSGAGIGGKWMSTIRTDPLGRYNVILEGSTQIFTLSGGVFSPYAASGSSLTLSGGVYTFTRRDGTIATFNAATFTCSSDWCTVAVINNVVFPSGEKQTFTLRMNSGFVGLQSINNNYGYQIKINYQCASPSTADCYQNIDNVVAINNTVEYCDPNANSCSLTNPWPTLHYTLSVPTNTSTVTDALGNTTTFSTQTVIVGGAATFVSTLTRPSGRTITYTTYAANPGELTVNEGTGYDTWTYLINQDVGTNLSTADVTDPAGHLREFVSQLDTGFPQSDTIDKGGVGHLNLTTGYSYDPGTAQPKEIDYPEHNKVKTTFDGRGNVIEVRQVAKPGSGLADIVSSATYISSCTTSNYRICNKPVSVTDANGNESDYTYDATSGGLLTATGPGVDGGRPQTRNTYQALHAWYLVGSSLSDGGPVYKLAQTSQCRLNGGTWNASSGTTTASTWGAMVWSSVPTCISSSQVEIASNSFQMGSSGAASNILTLSVTHAAGSGGLSSTSANTYDNYGNVATATDPNGNVSALFYNLGAQQVGSVGPLPSDSSSGLYPAVRTSYDVDGRVSEVEQGNAPNQLSSSWSGFNSLQEQILSYTASYFAPQAQTTAYVGGTSNPVAATQYSYDSVRNPQCTAIRENMAMLGSLPDACSLSTAGAAGQDHIQYNSYDAANRLIGVQKGYATSSVITETANAYSANSKVVTLNDAKDNESSFTYNGLDRLVQLNYPSKTTPGMPSSTDFEQYTYDPNGNQTQVRLRSGENIGYTFDALNRQTHKSYPSGSGMSDVYSGYDLAGDLLYAHYGNPGGTGVELTYDALGRKTSETSNSHRVGAQYDVAGNRTHLTYPDGVDVTYTYDALNRMYQAKQSSTVLAQYSYDDLSRVALIARTNSTATSTSFSASSADWSLTQSMASSGQNVTYGMAYTPAGQVAARNISNPRYAYSAPSVTSNYSTNGLNQYAAVSGASYTYDDRGNLTANGARIMTYDLENHLIGVSGSPSLAIAYDPAGRMQQTSYASSEQYLYDGSSLIVEYDASGNILRRYVPGQSVNETLVWYEGPGLSEPNWLHTDQQGSIIATSDASGAATAHAYSPTGVQAGSSGSSAPIFRYTGQAALPIAQLYNYRARTYDASMGRFLQADPAGYEAGTNLYTYAANDSVNNTDPTGRDCTPAPPVEGVEGVEVCGPSPPDTSLNPAVSSLTSGGLPSGGGGAPAPPSSQPRPSTNMYPEPNGTKAVRCLAEAVGKHKLAVATDLIGLIPAGGAVSTGLQLLNSTVGAANSYVNPAQNAPPSATGVLTFVAGYNLTALSLISKEAAPTLARVAPGLGSIVSAYALGNDIFSKGGINDDYNACMAR